MTEQEREPRVEFTHTIEELLEPFASKDPKIIKAYLTTSTKHTVPRLSLWMLATLYSCNLEEYPEASSIPEIKNFREEGFTEIDKRQLLDLKAIDEISELSSAGSEIEFSLIHSPANGSLGVKDTTLRKIGKEIEVLNKFRRGLLSKKGAGPSTGEVPGKSSV